MKNKLQFTLITFFLFQLTLKAQQQINLTVDVPDQGSFCTSQAVTVSVTNSVTYCVLKITLLNGESLNSPCNFVNPSGTNDYYIDIVNPFQCTFEITIPCKNISSASGTFIDNIQFESGIGNASTYSSIVWGNNIILTTQLVGTGGNSIASVTSATTVYAPISIYYVHFDRNTSNISVNYIDSYNSSSPGTPNNITRTIQYFNNGPDYSAITSGIFVALSFSDAFSCQTNDVNISQCEIRHMDASGTINSSFVQTNAGNLYNFTGSEVSFNNFKFGDYIEIVETFTFPDYQNVCMEGACSGGNKLLESQLKYGCTGDLCNQCDKSDNVSRGPLRPEIKIWRLAPDPVANSINGTPIQPPSPYHGFWQYGTGNQTSQTWRFLIQNTGQDVAKNPVLHIVDPYNSNFYYIKNIGINTTSGTFRFIPSNLADNVFITPRNVSPSSCSSCGASVKEVSVDLGRLLQAPSNGDYILAPQESVEVEFDVYYEVPSGDEDLFDFDKVLNDWVIGVVYNDECAAQGLNSIKGEYVAPDRYEIDPYSNTISPNNNPSKVYLKQDFTPVISSLSADNPTRSWGPFATLEAHNFEFCEIALIDDFRGANLISSKIDFANSTSMILEGGIRFLIDADELLDAANINLQYEDNAGILQNWPAANGTVGSYVCGQNNQYYADFLFSDCPSGQTLEIIYGILSKSDFAFDLRAACEPSGCTVDPNTSKNPEYRLKTYLLINDLVNSSLRLVPLTKKKGSIAINCPGCQLPGVTVRQSSDVLKRTSFGLEDANNNGLADLSAGATTPISSATYSNFNDLRLERSTLGDELKIVARAQINEGSAQTFADLHNRPTQSGLPVNHFDGPIHLDYFYGELSIENSSSDKFNVIPLDLTIEITNTITGAISQFSITPSSAAWSQFVYDKRDEIYSTGKMDIILVDLSPALINTQLPNFFPNGRLTGNEEFVLTMNFQQRNNYVSSYGSFIATDNRSMSKVQLNFYLSGVPLVGSTVVNPEYDAFTHHRRLIGQNVYGAADLAGDPDVEFSISSNMLYFCETYSQYHYFYTIAAEIYASAIDARLDLTNHYSKCTKGIQFKNTFSIGGELTNIFPFEFRKIPSLKTSMFNCRELLDYTNSVILIITLLLLPLNSLKTHFAQIRIFILQS